MALLLLSLLALLREYSAQTVSVKQGLLRGASLTTARGNATYWAFKGIPYGQAPVGRLRFKDPEPASPWTGTRDALQFGSKCTQFVNSTHVSGEEDCLFLNVYTPGLEFTSLKAVMVWIHGGAFQGGSSNDYQPEYFILEGVVVVTINYRLGALGYMSLLHPEIPGNAGPKDQVLALKWVQQNIAQFGGDPSSVTIFGGSAGGASVHSHLLSPLSKGLFQRAISQSGTMLCPWAFVSNPVERAKRLATAVGCTEKDLVELARCLREVPADQIATTMLTVLRLPDILHLEVIPFAPVVDAGVMGVDAFLPDKPRDLLKKGQFHEVPYIAGVNSAEAFMILSFIPNPIDFINTLVNNLEKLIPGDIINHILPELNLTEIIIEIFFAKQSFFRGPMVKLFKVKSDILFINPMQETLTLQSLRTSKPQYMYFFDFMGKFNLFRNQLSSVFRNIPGAVHGDETTYLFHTDLAGILPDDSPEMKMVYRMVRMWTNFSNTSNPTPVLNPLLMNVTWSSYYDMTKKYLHIGDNLTMEKNLRENHKLFWDGLQLITSPKK